MSKKWFIDEETDEEKLKKILKYYKRAEQILTFH